MLCRLSVLLIAIMLYGPAVASQRPVAPPSPAPPPVGMTTDRSAHVLLLWDVMPQLPAVQLARTAFEASLREHARVPVSVFDETLDVERFPAPAQQARLLQLLVDKYRDIPIDVIAVSGLTSLDAARALRARLVARPGVDSIPILYHLDEPGRPLAEPSFPRGPAITGIVSTSSETETAQLIPALVKGLVEVGVIASSEEQARFLASPDLRGVPDLSR